MKNTNYKNKNKTTEENNETKIRQKKIYIKNNKNNKQQTKHKT